MAINNVFTDTDVKQFINDNANEFGIIGGYDEINELDTETFNKYKQLYIDEVKAKYNIDIVHIDDIKTK